MRFLPAARARSSLRRGLGAVAAAVLLTATVTACGEDAETPGATDSPSASGAASESPSSEPSGSSTPMSPETLEVEVRGDEVTPLAEEVDLAAGDTLVLVVDADRAGELHVHSDPEQSFEFTSGTEEFELTLDTPGSVDIEEHESDALVARVLVR